MVPTMKKISKIFCVGKYVDQLPVHEYLFTQVIVLGKEGYFAHFLRLHPRLRLGRYQTVPHSTIQPWE